MSRALLILANQAIRNRALAWIKNSPDGTRVLFQEPKRSSEQNNRMWAMLTDIATQAVHVGIKHDAETWKAIFMNALGQENKFVKTLDGTGFFPIGLRSSKLSKAEMTELIDFIQAWGVQNGVTFHEPAREM
jgi:hypothetical protein